MAVRSRRLRYRDYLKIFGPALVLTVAAFVIAYQFVDPAPPEHIVIAAGSPGWRLHPLRPRVRGNPRPRGHLRLHINLVRTQVLKDRPRAQK